MQQSSLSGNSTKRTFASFFISILTPLSTIFKDQKSAPQEAFDASLILQSLGQKYGLSPKGDVLQPEPSTPAK